LSFLAWPGVGWISWQVEVGIKKEVSDLATTYLSGGILLISYVPSNDYC